MKDCFFDKKITGSLEIHSFPHPKPVDIQRIMTFLTTEKFSFLMATFLVHLAVKILLGSGKTEYWRCFNERF